MNQENNFQSVKLWWLIILTGIIFMASSIWVLQTSPNSFALLSTLFSVAIIAGGMSSIIFSLNNNKSLKGWGWLLVGGVFEILIGFLFLASPEYPSVFLPVVLGFWMLYRGINIVSSSLDLKDLKVSKWSWLFLLGTLVISIAVTAIFDPVFGSKNVIRMTYVGITVLGVSQILYGWKLRNVIILKTDSLVSFKAKINARLDNLKAEILVKNAQLSHREKINIEEKIEHIKYVLN